MAKKPRGLFAARKLKERRKKFRFAKKDEWSRRTGMWKKFDPLEGAPMARGIVIKKGEVEVRQPHSGMRKIVKVQLIKNGKIVSAYAGGPGAINIIEEHDEVLIERLRAPQRRAFGDMPGIKFVVREVNGVPLKLILEGKVQKPRR